MLFRFFFFFFNDTATTEIYTLSLHDALPIYREDGVPLVLGMLPLEPIVEPSNDMVDFLVAEVLVIVHLDP